MALIVGGTDKLAPLTYDGSTLALSSDFNVGSGDLLVDVSEDDLYTVGWTDYSSTTTKTHFTGTSTVWYKRIGKLCFFWFALGGTSTGTAFGFTLPYAAVNSGAVGAYALIARPIDNGSVITSGNCFWQIAESNYVWLTKDNDTNGWTGSGSCGAQGHGCFEID